MRKDSVVFGVAGIFFGVLVGWIIGSQQATGVVPQPAAASAPPAAAPAAQAPPAFDESRATALRATAERNPSDAETRVQLGNLYFDAERYADATRWYEDALKVDPRNVNASTDLGIAYYYSNQPDRALAQFDKIARDRSEAFEDPPEHRHRPRVRQAGSRRRREGVAAGARRGARQS